MPAKKNEGSVTALEKETRSYEVVKLDDGKFSIYLKVNDEIVSSLCAVPLALVEHCIEVHFS